MCQLPFGSLYQRKEGLETPLHCVFVRAKSGANVGLISELKKIFDHIVEFSSKHHLTLVLIGADLLLSLCLFLFHLYKIHKS